MTYLICLSCFQHFALFLYGQPQQLNWLTVMISCRFRSWSWLKFFPSTVPGQIILDKDLAWVFGLNFCQQSAIRLAKECSCQCIEWPQQLNLQMHWHSKSVVQSLNPDHSWFFSWANLFGEMSGTY